jgi:hypothetical protein
MEEHDELPLQVGETVRYNEYYAGTTGIIVEKLNDDYLRVHWADMSVPTTHRGHSLRRAGCTDRRRRH